MNVSRLGEEKGSCRGTKTVKGECKKAWTEGPEEAGWRHGRSTWCTEEQEYMVIVGAYQRHQRKNNDDARKRQLGWQVFHEPRINP